MTRSFRTSLLLIVPLTVVSTSCADREEELGDPVPPGVSLKPPLPAPTPGGLVLPGGLGSDTAIAETLGDGAIPEGQPTEEEPAAEADTVTPPVAP